MESQGCHDGQLVGRIHAFHIVGGIRFCQAQLLGVRQHRLIILPIFRHPREDVVGGAVDNPHDRGDSVGLQGLGQGANDRDGTAHAGFIIQSCITLFRRSLQKVPVQRQGYLVGRYHGFAVFQCLQHVLRCRMLAAHELCHQGDFRIQQHIVRVVGQDLLRHIAGALLVKRAHQHLLHPNRQVLLTGQFIRISLQQFPHTAAHVAAA